MNSFISEWSPQIFSVFALVIAVAGFILSQRASRRESYSIAHSLMEDLTTGEVAQARDALGILRYGQEAGWKALDYSTIVKQFYTLEWALERTAYGYDGLGPAGRKVQESMRDAITWHICELASGLAILRAAFGRNMVDDVSWRRLEEAVVKTNAKADLTPSADVVAQMRERLEIINGLSPA